MGAGGGHFYGAVGGVSSDRPVGAVERQLGAGHADSLAGLEQSPVYRLHTAPRQERLLEHQRPCAYGRGVLHREILLL